MGVTVSVVDALGSTLWTEVLTNQAGVAETYTISKSFQVEENQIPLTVEEKKGTGSMQSVQTVTVDEEFNVAAYSSVTVSVVDALGSTLWTEVLTNQAGVAETYTISESFQV